jgi:hypothetical protein
VCTSTTGPHPSSGRISTRLTLSGGVPWLDLSPLTLTGIEELTCSEDQALSNRLILGSIKTLRTINGKPAKEYLDEIWKKATM